MIFNAIKELNNIFKKVEVPDVVSLYGEANRAAIDAEINAVKKYYEAIQKGQSKDGAEKSFLSGSSASTLQAIKEFDFAKGTLSDLTGVIEKNAVAIQAQDKSFANAHRMIAAYNNAQKAANLSQQEFAQAVAKSNQPLGNYLVGLQGAQASMTGFIGSIVKATAAQVALNVAVAGLEFAFVILATQGIKLLDKIHESAEEATEAMNESFSKFESAKEEASNIESELKDINTQIDTINSKKGITLVEQAELDKLREAKEIAEMQLKAAQERTELAARESAKDTLNAFQKNYKNDVPTRKDDPSLKDMISDKRSEIDDFGIVYGEGVVDNIAQYLDFSERLSEVVPYLGKTYEQLQSDFSKVSGIPEEIKQSLVDNIWKEVSDFQFDYGASIDNVDEIQDQYRDRLVSYYEEFSGYRDKLLDLNLSPEFYKSLSDGEKALYDSIMNTHEMLEKVLYPEQWSQQKFEKLFDSEAIAKARDELVKYAASQKGIGVNSDYIKSNYADIEAELQKINTKFGTEFTIDDVVTYINSKAEVLDLDKLEMQAKQQLQKELNNLEVDVEPKIDMNQFSDWYDQLSLEQIEAFETIRVTPNFVISDYTPEQLQKMVDDHIEATKTKPLDFTSFVQGSDMESLDAELSKIETLKEAMQAVQSGEFDNAALLELTKEFPEAISNTGNMMEFLQGQIGKIIGKTDDLSTEAYDAEGIIADFDQAIKDAGDNEETVAQLMALRDVILEIAYEAANMPAINIEVEKSSLDALKTALDEARSAAGLTQESVEALQNRYKGLAGFNPLELFESTNTGLYLNNGVLASLEEAYEKNKFEEVGNQLAYLKRQLVSANSEAAKDFILEQITKLELLEAQYVGLTSEYNKWTQAQASANDRDMYEAVTGNKDAVKKLIDQGWAKSDDVTSYLDLFTSDNLIETLFGKNADGTNKSIEDLTAQQVKQLYKELDENIDGTKYSIFDFFTADKDGNVNAKGIDNFFKAVQQKFAKDKEFDDIINEDGSFNFLGDRMEYVADQLGISVELMEVLLRAAQEAGAEVEFNSMFTGLAEGSAEVDTFKSKLDELNKDYVKIDVYVNKESIESEIDKAKQEYQKAFESGDQDLLNYYGSTIDTLVARKNYKNFMGVDTSQLKGDVKTAIELLQDYQTAKNEIEASSEKGDKSTKLTAEQQTEDLEKQLDKLSPEIKAKLRFEEDESASSFLQKIEEGTLTVDIQAILAEANKSDIQMMYEMNGKTLTANMNVEGNAKEVVDAINAIPESKTITVNAQFGEQYNAVTQVIAALDSIVKTITIDAEQGKSIETVKSDLGTIGTGIPAVQINVNLDSASKTQTINDINAIGSDKTPVKIGVALDGTESTVTTTIDNIGSDKPPVKIGVELDGTETEVATSINNIGANVQPATITVELDPTTQFAVTTDINEIGANAQPVKITVNVDKTQISQLDSDVSKQRTANVVAIVYDGQMNALDQDVENVPDADITVNVFRDEFDGLKSEVENGLNATVNVTLNPEDPLSEIKQYAAHRDSNTNPDGTPKNTGGVINNPARSGSSSYGLGSQIKFENPLEEIEDTEVEIKAEVEGQDEIDTMTETIDDLEDHEFEVKASVLNQEELSKMAKTSKEITDVGVTAEATILGVEDLRILKSEISTVNGKIVEVGADVFGTDAVRELADAIDSVKSKTVTVTANVKKSSSSGTSGKATGTAFSQGNWGTKSSGTALGGELGRELIVRNGKFFTVGDESAEFFNYRRGDIIFNHEQTKQIFEHGRILYGQKRAHALASGTAFANGTAGGGIVVAPSIDVSVGTSSSSSSNNNSNSSSKKSKSKSDKEKEEFIDWIEIAIDRIERAIKSLDRTASSIYKKWETRNKALKDQISTIRKEIELQQQAYERYMEQASSIGLDETWAKLVREGSIDITLITDKDLIEQIKDYQEWYDKALDAQESVAELQESISDAYMEAFENVAKQFEGYLEIIDHEKSLLDEYIAQSEEMGHIVSTKYYEALISKEQNNIKKLEEERKALIKSMNEAVSSGAIEKESEAYYDMVQEINDVSLSIEEAKTSILEYGNAIRDIEWEIFDLIQERIGHIADETEFLIDLLSNDKLHGDGGQLTDEGLTTMGLHGMAYNTYMEQALRYAKEIEEIEKDIANDPSNNDLINRKQELIEAQRESILAAEDEKQAIVDLVQDGIDLEIEALEERIDKYQESIKSARDLYEYQKRLKEQTEDIASLEKQQLAYAGDDSEETRAKIQQIKVDLENAREELEETQYDHFIDDQEKMLDDMLEEYEELLNMRLDDIDALISDMIDEINANSEKINSTLGSLSSEFGYELSETMQNTISSNGNMITVYGKDIMNSIVDAGTTLSKELQSIDKGIWEMVRSYDKNAGSNISSSSEKTIGYTSGSYGSFYNQFSSMQNGWGTIFSPSNGEMLTPIAHDGNAYIDMLTTGIFDFANNPNKFIKDNLGFGGFATTEQQKIFSGNTYNNDFAIQIDLPNVSNYEQFKYEMQHDKSFERMIKSMTIDQMFGESPINKYKY